MVQNQPRDNDSAQTGNCGDCREAAEPKVRRKDFPPNGCREQESRQPCRRDEPNQPYKPELPELFHFPSGAAFDSSEFLVKLVFVRRGVGFGPLPLVRKQSFESAETSKSA